MDHNNHKKVVTRIPPSPTGHLHIGTARTALFNFLYAQQQGGEMVFRSEDTDRTRSTRAFEEEIIEGLSWLGLTWSNQEVYRQSEHAPLYRTHLEALISADRAYLSHEPSKQNPDEMTTVVRLRNPNTRITFTDLVRGEISFDTTELGDLVIARSLDDALYHFTVVVDDHHMGVTHVIRGEDHISNTPRQILIQEALGFTRPVYAHLPLILAPDRSKMSKRHGAVSLAAYRKEGFLKEAIINYLALLGWNPGTDQELFTLSELIAAFDINKIQKAGAVFDIQKFTWFNKMHLAALSGPAFKAYLLETENSSIRELLVANDVTTDALLPLIRERHHTRHEFETAFAAGEYDFAFTRPTYATELLRWKNDPSLAAALPRLRQIHALLSAPEARFDSADSLRTTIMPYAEEVGRGEVLWPLRVALSGREKSPDPFTLMAILKQNETLARIAAACDKIGE